MFRTLIPIILIVASGLLGFFYIFPIYEKITIAMKEEKGIDEALQKTKEIGTIATELRNKVESISVSDIDKLDTILPSEIDEIRFVNMLNSIASRHNLSLGGPTVTEGASGVGDADEQGLNTIGVSFSVTASYETFIAFAQDLERSLSIADVHSIALSAPSAGEDDEVSDSYNYDIELSTYWLE